MRIYQDTYILEIEIEQLTYVLQNGNHFQLLTFCEISKESKNYTLENTFNFRKLYLRLKSTSSITENDNYRHRWVCIVIQQKQSNFLSLVEEGNEQT